MLETGQGGARLEPQAPPERSAQVLVDPQGVGLAAAAVQRQHPLPPKTLPQRMLTGQPFELGDHLPVPPAGQVGVDPFLESDDARLVEAGRLGPDSGDVDDVGQRLPPP